jgi:hypothetical protein
MVKSKKNLRYFILPSKIVLVNLHDLRLVLLVMPVLKIRENPLPSRISRLLL